jgi:DNA mismatch repair protein MutS2
LRRKKTEKKVVKKEKPKPKKKLERGDSVKITGQQTVGEIIEISGNQAMVAFDSLKIRVPLSKLTYVYVDKSAKKKVKAGAKYGSIMSELNQKMADFKTTLDIRGQRAEEAMIQVQSFIDDAMLLGVRDVEILHGKGDGVLRSVIRDWLKHMPDVAKYSDQHPDMGGHGITLIKLRG